ncbi:MAG TPA: hypothetical protein VE287_00955 [Actinopolymorphaceae bacterium]|nr:hypothetical protein [Actinopolymorphaceae bacterium]
MVWDPFGTLAQVLWIGGAQWAGKSTVARILATTYGLTAYHYDYQAVRGHYDRLVARRATRGEPLAGPDPDAMWVLPTPEQMARDVLASFVESFEWTLDDLRALVSGRPIVAEGWGLRPEMVLPILDSPRRMVVMVPTEEFRREQVRRMPRAQSLGAAAELSDPERGQRNRLDRDRLVALDAVRTARANGIWVIEVDGSLDEEQVADQVADHFAPYIREASAVV